LWIVEEIVFSSYWCRFDVDQYEDIPYGYSDPSILVPKIGQLFEEDVDGYRFYNLYARFTGFGIRMSKNRIRKDTGVKTMQEYCCIRQVCSLNFT
jgi:hypothetical protein